MHALRTGYSTHRRWALLADLVLVVLFTVIGRASHQEPLTPAGVFTTTWPFVVACLAGWAVIALAKLTHFRVWPAGVLVWGVTVAGGLGLRVLSGGTAATAFVIVASITLALFLLVPRAVLGRRERTSLRA